MHRLSHYLKMQVEGALPEIVTQLEKWEQMSVEKGVPYIRAVQATRLLCNRVLPHLKFNERFVSLFRSLPGISVKHLHLKMHWIERVDGSVWIYFCRADRAVNCDKCDRRIECLVL